MHSKIQSEEDFFQEVTQNVRDLVNGERLTSITTVSFASVETMQSIQHVKPLDDYLLEVTFKNGESRVFDVKPYLDRGIFIRLKDVTLFNQAYVAYGTVCWPGGLDIAPDTIYLRSNG